MLSKNLERSIRKALSLAREYGHEYATIEHLLVVLTDDPDAKSAMFGCSIDVEQLQQEMSGFLKKTAAKTSVPELKKIRPTAGLQRVVHRASIYVHAAGKKEVNGSNVLAEIFTESDSHAALSLVKQNITRLDVLNYISYGVDLIRYDAFGLSKHKNADAAPKAASNNFEPEEYNNNSRGSSSTAAKKSHKEAESALTNYCINLNRLAKEDKIDILIGREKEIERTIEILCRRTKNNPIYVGEPGVGKTAIAEGLALKIVSGQVPPMLKNAVIYSLDLGSLVSGTRYRGDFEERVKSVVKEIQKLPSAIIFIDEIHNIMGAGSTIGGSLDAANLLKPALARGTLRCIGSTTFKEYHTYFEKDFALVRRFQKIVIEEPNVEHTIKILKGIKSYYESYHDVYYTPEAIDAAATLSDRYIHDRNLPDKAIDVLDEAGAHYKLFTAKGTVGSRGKVVTVTDIENIVAKIAKIPAISISVDDSSKLKNLQLNLKKIIFGQDNAVEELCSAIKLSRAGLRSHKRPIGCYLFSGPTGVGKTELAKQLAISINMELLRFDMSEYMEKHSISRLIGSPPGYVGFEQGGLLTDAIKKSPYSVILLDEIEKAHPEIYNILLQVMDYGQLTDNNGRNINCCNAIIIMTTNVGAKELSKSPFGFAKQVDYEENNDEINRLFTPEFLNRLDAIIPFVPLTSNVVTSVVNKFIIQLEEQLEVKGVTLKITPAARKYLCVSGYDNENGARVLDRIIDQKIKKHLADELLFGKLSKGGSVSVDVKNNQFTFSFEKKKVLT
jgi:ATP-dependent Clp protease ATP-binding subunit ClpA